ncbi:MAG: transcription termination factor NusA [Bacilli bacterium]|jgi:N utilization substance protein A|nr:transcription termination factor NusA [Bacilli bacterium]
MDAQAFASAIHEIAESKGLTDEAVVNALKDALQKAYLHYLAQGLAIGDDAVVTVDIDMSKGEIVLAQVKKVVDEVQDDYLEISVADANKGLKKKKYKAGDDFPIPCPAEELSKMTAQAVKTILRQKIAEAERVALYDVYKDHIGEMITGTVEKADDRSVTVNIGRTMVELGRREMIGDEYFKVGDPIKVYIQEVKEAQQEGKPSHGPQIEVTRSSEGFLKRLFEEEIHEIYDGTVLIKGIAREAGVRSKVAVMSTNEDVDATGACIGPSGSRIQKIVSQLGNGKDKEKIDIIAYSDNPGLYVAESLRPAQVLGVALQPVDPASPYQKAIAVVKDEQLSLAIGKKGANARLANKLTGFSIDIMEESEAQEEALEYATMEELQKQADDEKKVLERQAYAEKSQEEARKRAEEAALAATLAAPVAKAHEEEADSPIPEAPVAQTVAPLPSPETQKASTKEEEIAPAPAPIEEKPVMPTLVKTTKTLDELEKELEEEKKRVPEPSGKPYEKRKYGKRPRKITDEEQAHAKPTEVVPSASAMPIYSQEELDEIAKEEEEASADAKSDVEDLDNEDFDKYYDDK